MIYLVYNPETDGETFIRGFKDPESLMKTVEKLKLSRYDYAIVKGEVLKNFDQQIDLKKVK